MALAWEDEQDAGFTAPSVVSRRADFPRDIAHLNPVPDDWPASPCLSRSSGGLAHLYDRFGTQGIVEALRNWMLDAAAGTLDPTEWHPVPMGAAALGRDAVAVIADPAFFQELAAGGKQGGFAAGVARQAAPRLVRLFTPDASAMKRRGQKSELAEECIKQTEAGRKAGAASDHYPWLLVWGRTDLPGFGEPRTLAELLKQLDQIGIGDSLRTALAAAEEGGATGRRARTRDKAVLLLLALQRSKPLLSDIHGISKIVPANHFELAAFLVCAPTEAPLLHTDNRVARAFMLSWPNPALFRSVAGTPRMLGLTAVGLGALGGGIATQLLRCGLDYLVAIDSDRVQPHNVARHEATALDLVSPKADWIRSFAQSLGLFDDQGAELEAGLRGTTSCVRSHSFDVLKTSDDELRQAAVGTGVILDATASAPVRERLTSFSGEKRLVRIEIYDGGKLGLISVGGVAGNPDTLDLYYCLPMLFEKSDAVKSWLKRERAGQNSIEEMTLGFGCASATMRLPKYAVDQHATAFMPTIVDVLRQDAAPPAAGIGLNVLDDHLRPKGWQWHEVPEFAEFVLNDGWTLRVEPSVLDEVRTLRAEHDPYETGGYLFGGCNLKARRITVVAATPAPSGTHGSPTELDLARVDDCPRARTLVRRTAGRLHLVGTWHSHPDGHPLPSAQDLLTISKMAAENAASGLPTLMLIQSETVNPTAVFCSGEHSRLQQPSE
ncbi:MAG TPA: Mov34/MPN/PAD-1 family protein [Azospirillaceae bacterium]|nr:Mov34/MPN/PAD-1 family protein [Azospirillaceae bacterium]